MPTPVARPTQIVSEPEGPPKYVCELDTRAPAAVAAILPVVAEGSKPVTRVRVDGLTDDWAGRPALNADTAGDAEPGFPDFTAGYSFVNDHALYLRLDSALGEREFDSFELDIASDSRRLFFGWAPGQDKGWHADTTTEWVDLGIASHSDFSLGEAFEARIDLRDLGNPSEIRLLEIRVMVGDCCGPTWRAADRWSPEAEPPTVDEVDPQWLVAPSSGALQAVRKLNAPDARAISLAFDESRGRATVKGLAGSVPEESALLIGNLELDDYVTLKAGRDGTFEVDVAAVPGTHVLIKQDTTGRVIRSSPNTFDDDVVAPGVLLEVPVGTDRSGIAFGAGAQLCCGEVPEAPWGIEGVFSESALAPGDEFRISGRVTVFTGDPGASLPPTWLPFDIYLLGDETGRQVGRAGKFVSPFLTPTGLPIERTLDGPPLSAIGLGGEEVRWRFDGGSWVADFDMRLHVPEGTRPGVYALIANGLWNLSETQLEPSGLRPHPFITRDNPAYQAMLGAITVGNPERMRLAATLLADELSEGSRGGVLAREDAGQFDIAPRAVTRHDPILPRLDGYGAAWSYRLEPYLPMVDMVDRVLPNPPAIRFDLSRSVLTITVERPDGLTDVLGPAPLARYAVKSPRTPWDGTVGGGGGEAKEIPQLQGAGNTFAYTFPVDGDYVITLDGGVCDAGGHGYEISGTYDLTIASVLDIETSLLPGTPFEVGDSIAPTLTVMPGVPAQVAYTVTHFAADGTRTSRTFTGEANGYGWWDGGGETWTFERDGEYRVDVDARYTDRDGNLWAGRLRFGSVVATPDAPIVAHGRRGPDNRTRIPPPWGFDEEFEHPDVGHMHIPYFNGDIVWGSRQLRDGFTAADAVVTYTSVQVVDERDPLVARARRVTERWGQSQGPSIEEMIRAGEMPLVTAPEPPSERSGAHPDELSLWAYTYVSAQRPGVRVREVVNGNDVVGSYWRFEDAFHAQSGNGPQGDQPGDFKFMYDAAVIRDPAAGLGVYAIHGSSWVHAADDDPLGARFFPPFRGAAGGPDGGPLFTVHGREIDLFMMPMGVRPGAILESGDVFAMAGPLMPALPSRVDYTVISPDGTERRLGGRANAVGYFYDPDDDFIVDRPGLWIVRPVVTHDGMTSAGPVEQPFPSGGPLTPDGETFAFVVADEATHRLQIETDLSELTPADWYGDVREATFFTQLPDGWQGDSARLIVTMPGVVLVDEDVEVELGLVAWRLDAHEMNQLASNFDIEPGLADTVTITVYAEGVLDGEPAQAAGATVVHGARVPDAPPSTE